MVNHIFSYLGPVVSIQNTSRSKLVASQDWQAKVRKLHASARFVVVQVSYRRSPGLFWEIGRIFEAVPFKPVLFILPFAVGGLVARREGYDDFWRWFTLETNIELENLGGNAGYVLFDSLQSATTFEGSLKSLEDILGMVDPEALIRYRYDASRFRSYSIVIGILILSLILFLTIR